MLFLPFEAVLSYDRSFVGNENYLKSHDTERVKQPFWKIGVQLPLGFQLENRVNCSEVH